MLAPVISSLDEIYCRSICWNWNWGKGWNRLWLCNDYFLRVADELIDWLHHTLINWLIGGFDWLVVLIGWFCLSPYLIDWLSHRLINWLTGGLKSIVWMVLSVFLPFPLSIMYSLFPPQVPDIETIRIVCLVCHCLCLFFPFFTVISVHHSRYGTIPINARYEVHH